MLFALLPLALAQSYQPADGDVLLQTSTSAQSLAIQLATGSTYSHTGVVLHRDGAPYVYEAVQPVRYVPLDAWLASGEAGQFTAMRPSEPLSPESTLR